MSGSLSASRRRWRLLGLMALLGAALALQGWAQDKAAARPDWPGLWGPDRDARVAGPLRVSGSMQVKEIWRRPIGKGFSEVAMAEGRGYVPFTDGEVDQLAAVDLTTGKEIWKTRLDPTYRGHDGSDDGPISTPVLVGERIFFLNTWGKLFAFDRATGRVLWSRDLKTELGASPPFWGFATTPLPVGGSLVIQAGGEKSNNLVALDQATGKTLWSSQPASQNGYSSPVLVTLGGVPQVVAATTDKVFGVKPEDGTVLWSVPSPGESRQSAVPLPGDRLLLVTWQQASLYKVTREEGGAWKVQELWGKPVLKSTYSPAVYHDGSLYGINGTNLVCVNPETGEVRWREKVYDASLLLVGDYLAVLGQRSGSFQIVEATPEGFREKLKARVFNPGARSLTGPMFVGGRFLLRNVEEMVMFELVEGAPAPAPAASKEGR